MTESHPRIQYDFHGLDVGCLGAHCVTALVKCEHKYSNFTLAESLIRSPNTLVIAKLCMDHSSNG